MPTASKRDPASWRRHSRPDRHDVRLPDGDGFRFTEELKRAPATSHAGRSRPEARLVVTDNGGGIPSDVLPHVFELFVQAAAASGSGLGIGLVVVRGLVDSHGERIYVDSEAGRGTTFTVLLPLAGERPAPGA